MEEFQKIVYSHRNDVTARAIKWLGKKAKFERMLMEAERRRQPVLIEAIERARRLMPWNDRKVLLGRGEAAIKEMGKRNREISDKKIWEKVDEDESETMGRVYCASKNNLCEILGDGEGHLKDTSMAYRVLRTILRENLFGENAMPFTRERQDELVRLALSLAREEIMIYTDILHVVAACGGLGMLPPMQITLLALESPALFIRKCDGAVNFGGLAARAYAREMETSLALIELLYPEEQSEISGQVFDFASS